MRGILYVLILGTMLGNVVLDSSARAQEAPSVEGTQTIAVSERTEDADIERRLTDILASAGWYRGLGVEVKEGIVYLDGATASGNHRDWAGSLAAKTEGVVAVVNRIEVQPEFTLSLTPVIDELGRFGREALTYVPLALLALLVLPLAWLLARLVSALARRLLRKRVASPFLRQVLARAIALPVLLLGIYLILQVAGLTGLAFSVVGGAGMIGIVVSFAFRDIAENFLATLIMSIRQPFRRGDWITVAEHSGIVQSMNARSTVLLSAEGNHIQIPNATIFKTIVINYSTSPGLRTSVDIGIGYDDSVTHAQTLIHQVLTAHEAIIAHPEPMVLVDALGASTVNLKAYFWFDGQTIAGVKLRSAVLRQIKNTLTEAGISMPDEAREIIFPQGVPVVSPSEVSAVEPPQGVATPATPAPSNVVPASDNADVTSAEGGLETERRAIEQSIGTTTPPEGRTDLLGGNDSTRSHDEPPHQ